MNSAQTLLSHVISPWEDYQPPFTVLSNSALMGLCWLRTPMPAGPVTLHFDGLHPPSYHKLLAHSDLTYLAKVSIFKLLLSRPTYPSLLLHLFFLEGLSDLLLQVLQGSPSQYRLHLWKNRFSRQYKSGWLFLQLRSCVLLSLLLFFKCFTSAYRLYCSMTYSSMARVGVYPLLLIATTTFFYLELYLFLF